MNEINFNLYEDTIEIEFAYNNVLQFKTNDNIILSSNLDSNGGESTTNTQNSASQNQDSSKLLETQDNKFANNILTILINIYLGEKEFFNEVENSKSNINKSTSDYFLVNSDMFTQFKQFFTYNSEIKNIVDFYKISSISDIDKHIDKISKDNKIYFKKILE